MSDDQVYAGVEKALRKYFGKRGDQVVQDNLKCVKLGFNEMKEIPREIMPWNEADVKEAERELASKQPGKPLEEIMRNLRASEKHG